tara:strand:- start:211 stop:468 length:258 start_codon:yes stop_codon:yes gene_type:complete
VKYKKKKNELNKGEHYALYLMSLTNPDLYPDKGKRIPVELITQESNGDEVGEVVKLTIPNLIGLISTSFHILEHEYNDVVKGERN